MGMVDVIEPNELRPVIAANILRLRKEKSLSQEDLATKLGISRVQLNRLENGHNSPSAELLYSLADVLGVSADCLRQIASQVA